eukprot:6194884-Pleurochrysis_carterae.AAC.3
MRTSRTYVFLLQKLVRFALLDCSAFGLAATSKVLSTGGKCAASARRGGACCCTAYFCGLSIQTPRPGVRHFSGTEAPISDAGDFVCLCMMLPKSAWTLAVAGTHKLRKRPSLMADEEGSRNSQLRSAE